MDNTIEEIKKLIEKDISKIEKMKKSPEVFTSNEYGRLLHKKEIFKQILNLIEKNQL